MTLEELRDLIDSLIDKTSPSTPTTIDDLVLSENSGWQYVDAVTQERTAEILADEAEQIQLPID